MNYMDYKCKLIEFANTIKIDDKKRIDALNDFTDSLIKDVNNDKSVSIKNKKRYVFRLKNHCVRRHDK